MVLEAYFRDRVDHCRSVLRLLDGNLAVTGASVNSGLVLAAEVNSELGQLKKLVEDWEITLVQVEKAEKALQRARKVEQLSQERLATVLKPSKHGQVQQSKVGPTSTSGDTSQETSKADKKPGKTRPEDGGATKRLNKQQPSREAPLLPLLTLDQFEKIPSYMKGRLQYDEVNSMIRQFNDALQAKYAFLAKGFQANASLKMKNKYKDMKSLENKDTRGKYFVVVDDLKATDNLKLEASRRKLFTILRHFQLLQEIRGPDQVQRFAVLHQ